MELYLQERDSLDPKGLGIEREVSRPASDIKPDISGGVGMKTHAK